MPLVFRFEFMRDKIENLFEPRLKNLNPKIANLFSIYELQTKHHDVFETRLNRLCTKYKINLNDFFLF